jgi:hypothetical protein
MNTQKVFDRFLNSRRFWLLVGLFFGSDASSKLQELFRVFAETLN